LASEVFLQFIGLLFTVGIGAFTIIKVARVFANRPRSVPEDVTVRLEELERAIQTVQQELSETQERLDFAERLLTATREARRLAVEREPR
jgi:predicted  nucleic acid-binding Zn-ribbon protein